MRAPSPNLRLPTLLLPALLSLCALACVPPTARAGVAVALHPTYAYVGLGAEFDVTLDVTESGSLFNGYHAIVTYDPAALTFMQAAPLSGQLGCLVTGGCSTACGQTFHMFHAAGDSLSVDLSLLCDQVFLSGPGQVYKLHFKASNTSQFTWVRLRTVKFYSAGLVVAPVSSSDCRVAVGNPGAVDDAVPPASGLQLHAEPNPALGPVSFAIESSTDGEQSLDVLDLSGRLVRHLAQGWQPRGSRKVTWDGHDGSGARVPAGVYLVRVRAGDRVAIARVARLH